MSWTGRQPRPLDRIRSIKVKLGIVVVTAVVTTVGAIYGSLRIGFHSRFAFAIGIVVSLVVIQVLAHGIVLPLRQMVGATKAMAQGDYSQRITATSQDEVGILAAAFNSMSEQLARADSERRELVANVSHELRTPIASLRARLENLADGVEEFDPEAVEAMLRATHRLSALVDQLLELSQYESGATQLERQRFDVASVVATATAELAPVRADVRLDVHVADGLEASGDTDRIHEVLTNLLTNAVRVTPPAGIVTIRARAEAGRVRVEVSDCGPGIPEPELEAVFHRFHRVDAARSPTSGGAGLGLAIARSIVELHGGTIHAEPNLPHGCRMVVDLPD